MPRRVECFFHLFCWSDQKKVIFLHIGQIYLLARSILFFCKSEIRVNIECRKFKFHFLRSHLNKMLPSFKRGKIVWIFFFWKQKSFCIPFFICQSKKQLSMELQCQQVESFQLLQHPFIFFENFFFFRKYFLFLEIQFQLWPNRSIVLGNMI